MSEMFSEEMRWALQSPLQGEFVAGVRRLARQLRTHADPSAALCEALLLVGASTAAPAQQAQRAALTIRIVQSDFILTAEIVRRLAALPSASRSGIASALPPELVPGLYGTAAEVGGPERRGNATGTDERAPVCRPVPGPPASSDEAVGRGAIVVLLSNEDNQEGNARLLGSDGFGAYRVSGREDLAHYLGSPDVCGFVVDGSFWRGRTPQEQTEILTEIVQYSSFTCLVVDTSGFHEPTGIRQVIEAERPSEPRWVSTQLRENSTLFATDLQCFRFSADLLSTRQELAFVPSDLGAAERLALVAACRSFFREEYQRCEEKLVSLAFRSIPTGLSSAKTMLIRFNDSGVPVLIKVDARDRILDEVSRFDRYIRRSDGILHPSCHFHNDVGVIIFGLVEDDERASVPAPSLDAQVRDALTEETYPTETGSVGALSGSITEVVERTCARVEELNKRRYSGPHESQAYLRASGLRELESNGVRWDIPGLAGSSVAACLDRAYALTEPLMSSATVHGDLHLGNILVPREGVPQLIDYAYSGPGHPAYDFVRLETALCSKYLRPLGSDDEFTALQRELSISKLDSQALAARFPIWWSSAVNAALLRGAVRCRDGAISVLRDYGFDDDQYLGCKFVVCCWSLTIPGLQPGLIRATIAALAPRLCAASG